MSNTEEQLVNLEGLDLPHANGGFTQELGLETVSMERGRAVTKIVLEKKHLQFMGQAHAGVMATMADHTSGMAGYSMLKRGYLVVTVEFKINLLRPGIGTILWAEAEVLKPGKTLSVVECSIFAGDEKERKLVAKATVTLAVIKVPI